MRRKNRKEINIFSMSALDLFASAMGAFVLIAVIALPYYLNIDPTILKSKNKQIVKLEQNQAECQKERKKLLQQLADANEKSLKIKSTIESQASQIASLKEKLKNSIKFSLLGISTKATSFTVVVDMSNSVKEYKTTIMDTLKRLVAPMKGKTSIQIIGYRGASDSPQIISWQKPYTLKKYDSSNEESLNNFFQKIVDNLSGGTPTEAALREAIKYNSEAIILITDGKPNNSNPDSIVSKITKLNSGRQEIHTIALGNYLEKQELTKFLIELSSKNGGGFMGVASLD